MGLKYLSDTLENRHRFLTRAVTHPANMNHYVKETRGEYIVPVAEDKDEYLAANVFWPLLWSSEQALLLAMVEMVISGVSTCKVRTAVEELCGTEFSRSTVSELCKGLDPVVHDWDGSDLSRRLYPFCLRQGFA